MLKQLSLREKQPELLNLSVWGGKTVGSVKLCRTEVGDKSNSMRLLCEEIVGATYHR